MNRLRCGPLAAWASAWLAGLVAFDDVLVAVSAGAPAPALAAPVPSHRNAMAQAHASTDGQPVAIGELLIAWRQAGAPVRLILPVPGDVRGAPTSAAFQSAALDAGQAVVGADVATVPLVIDHRPSSAPPRLIWRRYDVDVSAVDYVSVPDAQFELAEAIRECASAMVREVPAGGGSAAFADLAGSAAEIDVATELAAARRAGERLNLPAGFPPRAVMLVAQAERLAAVLAIAEAAPVTASSPGQRARSLSPLVSAVRRARVAGYNALAE